MLEISKNEFLSSMDYRIREEEITDIRAALEEVWEQSKGQAEYDYQERTLQNDLGAAVMRAGGPEEVAERAGVSSDSIKRWVTRPFDMKLSELRRLQLATGMTMEFQTLSSLKED